MASTTSRAAVPGVFLISEGDSPPLPLQHGMLPQVPNPSDSDIAPATGDDTAAPNALKSGKCNALVTHLIANAGYSASGKSSTPLQPSSLSYDVAVKREAEHCSLQVCLSLEFKNPCPGESMVCWLKKLKQFVSDEKLPEQELVLMDTQVQDWVSREEAHRNGDAAALDGHWVTIATDIHYTATADAVTQAVIESDSGQTAARVKSSGEVEDAKMGPIGERGRLLLTYACEKLYSYAQMSVPGADPTQGERNLVPLALHLPFAHLGDGASSMGVRVGLSAPPGSSCLDPTTPGAAAGHASFHMLPYTTLRSALPRSKGAQSQVLVVQQLSAPDPTEGSAGAAGAGAAGDPVPAGGFHQSHCPHFWRAWEQLPATPWCIFFMLSVPDEPALVSVKGAVPPPHVPGPQVALQWPQDAQDARLMRVSTPGGGTAMLLRAKVSTGAATPTPDSVTRVLLHLNISDASGSTGMRLGGGGAMRFGGGGRGGAVMRDAFNHLAERRVLKRLQAIPQLLALGLLRPQDVWLERVFIFDHGVRQRLSFSCTVAQLADGQLVAAALAGAAPGAALGVGLVGQLQTFLTTMRGVRPGGTTSFAAPARGALQDWPALQEQVKKLVGAGKDLLWSAFVNFDTDGGSNGGSFLQDLREMVKGCAVKGGIVCGYGAWVNQHCASQVASVLRGPCMLSMTPPVDEGGVDSPQLDRVFARDMAEWLRVVRSQPVKVTAHASEVSWPARHGLRNDDRLQILGVAPAAGTQPNFGPPDVSRSTLFSAATVEGFQAGDEFMAYLLVRLAPAEAEGATAALSAGGEAAAQLAAYLASKLVVEVAGAVADVRVVPEGRSGVFLGHHWLQSLAEGSTVVPNSVSMVPRLRTRLQDDLSFAWNLAAPDGATALLGRAATAVGRPSVAPSCQPEEPQLELELETSEPQSRGFSFGFAAPAPPRMMEAAIAGAPTKAKKTKRLASAGRGGAPPLARGRRRASPLPQEPEAPASSIAGPSEILCFTSGLRVSSKVEQQGAGAAAAGRPNTWDGLSQCLLLLQGTGLHFWCDVCSSNMLAGSTLHHCLVCVNYDACASCHMFGKMVAPHSAAHASEALVITPQGSAVPVAGGRRAADTTLATNEAALRSALTGFATWHLLMLEGCPFGFPAEKLQEWAPGAPPQPVAALLKDGQFLLNWLQSASGGAR